MKYYCNALLFLHAIFTNFGDYHDNNMYRLNDALQDANNKKAEQSEAMLDFEKQCMNIKHNHCICCRMVGINLKINKNSICEKCAKLKNPNYYLEKRQLPVWRKDGVPIYTVPKELESLSHAENSVDLNAIL